MQKVTGLKSIKIKSLVQGTSNWFVPREPGVAPSDVLVYAPGALRIAILVFLGVGSAVSIPYIIEHASDTRLVLTRLVIIALTAIGAVMTLIYVGKYYRAWVLLTAGVGISGTLFFITYVDGPNINPHAAILATYVIGAGLCLGRKGVIASSIWLGLNYLVLQLIADWDVWPHPSYLSVATVQHENVSAMFFLLLILIPLLLGYMAKVERYVTNLKNSYGVQQRLLQQVIAAQEAERKRISHLLHEGPVQDMVALRLAVRNDVSEEELVRMIDDTVTQLRTVSSNLHPATLDLYGLPAALGQLAVQQEQSGNIQVEVSHQQLKRLDPQVGIVLFRIAQESLNNIRRHSGAKHAWISVEETAGGVTLEARDDGQGFEVDPVQREAAQAGHLGLVTMHELATSVGGTLQIASGLGQGTTVRVTVPYSR